jgi:hypothetical protein
VQEKNLTNEEIQGIRNRFYPAKDFLDPEFGEKFDAVFDMAKKLNSIMVSLKTLDKMFLCIKESGYTEEDIDGMQLFLNEIIKED